MKCKDCFHYALCPKWDDWNDRPYKDGYSDQCQNYSKFKDKLHIVELPCFFGDKVYFPYTGENYPQKLVLLKLNAVNVGEVVRFTTDGYGTHIRVQFRENGCTELTFYADEINKKVFFDKEEAEAKLKELNNG